MAAAGRPRHPPQHHQPPVLTRIAEARVGGGTFGFYGDVLHNTLFQKEELDALERDVSARSLGVPELRTGQHEALDVVVGSEVF